MRKKPTTPTVSIRVCTQCGEAYETTDPESWRCPGGCLHRWGRGNDDPVAWDDEDAFRKSVD